MNELTTDFWALLLPEEWHAEQDDETIVITDNDEVSVIEMTDLHLAKDQSIDDLLKELSVAQPYKARLADMDVMYQEFADDGMYWREWFVEVESVVLAISHGCDIDNKGMDDASIDEILSTLALKKSSND